MTTHRSTTLLLGVALAAGTLLGCSDDGGGGDDEALSAEAFATAANAVCAETNGELDELFDAAPLGPESTPEEQEAFVADLVTILRAEGDQLDALVPDDAIAEQVDELLASFDASLDDLADLGAGALAIDTDAMFAEVDALGADLGLDVCVEQ